ncbi:tetratricopeptide repeat protein [Streptomyces netropsis]|uniref:tetratricopeptide repeat protein n=1 Tax=Streptomyces netropsis TaxID=55404 RepID=UPI0030D0D62B
MYLLTEYQPRASAQDQDNSWLTAQPSRLLNARFQVVDFTGRHQEEDQLATWRDKVGPRLSALWLHAPGGQGKTRLAAQFADRSAAAGWKVVAATHGPGTILPPAGSQDMRLGNATGLLLVVDYADRWPPSHLAWLFSNALFHQQTPTRLLLLARSAKAWTAIRTGIEDRQADAGDLVLQPLNDQASQSDRERMFMVARDCFAARYNLADPTVIEPPGSLHRSDFGLTLALHIAALVAVDAHAHGVRPPEDMADLSSYLLNRERKHWAQLHANQGEGLDFQTPPSVMTRAVFTAALTGATTYPRATAIFNSLQLELHPDRVLTDHALCYPPADPGTVLEPLYPDRLAEDFLALTLPGHTTTAWPTESWAPSTAEALTTRDANGLPPVHITRALVFLAAAAAPDRWPHVITHLDKILRADPELAIAAGSATLTALADLDLDPTLLEAIESHFPDGRHTDLAPGIAALTARLTAERLGKTKDPVARARLHHSLAKRLGFAGMPQEALAATEKALKIREKLAEIDAAQYGAEFALMLNNRGAYLADMGRPDESLAAIREAIRVYRSLPTPDEVGLARALTNLSGHLSDRGLLVDSEAAIAEAINLIAAKDPTAYQPELIDSLLNLSNVRARQGNAGSAIIASRRALGIARRLYCQNQAAFAHILVRSLVSFSIDLSDLGKSRLALKAARIDVEIARRLARANPGVYEPDLASGLTILAARWRDLEDYGSALPAANEAVEIRGQLADGNPVLYEPKLARSLLVQGNTLSSMGRNSEAEAPLRKSLKIRRRLVADNPVVHEADVAESLYNLGRVIYLQKRPREAHHILRAAADIYGRLLPGNPALASRHADAIDGLLRAMAKLQRKSPISTNEIESICRELSTGHSQKQ